MMAVIDPTPGAHGTGDHLDSHPALDAERRIDPRISGVVPACEELEAQGRIYFDEVGDREILEGRGVGESCEFDRRRRGNRS